MSYYGLTFSLGNLSDNFYVNYQLIMSVSAWNKVPIDKYLTLFMFAIGWLKFQEHL